MAKKPDFLDGFEEELLDIIRPRTRPRQSAQVVSLDEWRAKAHQDLVNEMMEQRLAEKAQREAEAARTCHVGPGDPDWRGRAW